MSERYGVWMKGSNEWLHVDADRRNPVCILESLPEADAVADHYARTGGHKNLEVRPYPSPEAKPAPLTPSAVDYSVISPATIAAYQRDQTLLLAFALFASDPAVEAFVTARAENADRYEATLRIAFDRDENGWATHARNRAARVIARMSK